MRTIWMSGPRCLAKRFSSISRLALADRPDAGRGDTMSPIIASSQLARMDK